MGTRPQHIATAARLALKSKRLAVAELGAQEIHGPVSRDDMEAMSLPDGTDIDALHTSRSVPAMFGAFGLRYVCFDIFEAPAVRILDLNAESAPADCLGAFGVVTNFGTTEHVFNQANAFRVIHDLCAVGGFMWHNLPMSHFWGHGFYKYDPHFFFAIQNANAYEAQPYRYYDVEAPRAPVQDHLSAHGFDASGHQRFVAVEALFRKTRDAPFRMPTDLADGRVTPELASRYVGADRAAPPRSRIMSIIGRVRQGRSP